MLGSGASITTKNSQAATLAFPIAISGLEILSRENTVIMTVKRTLRGVKTMRRDFVSEGAFLQDLHDDGAHVL